MEKRRHIVILGKSVILGALGVSLQRSLEHEVTVLSPTPDTLELELLSPDVVIFDLESARPEAAFALLETHPGVQVIGVSPDSNQVRVWFGQQLQELSTLDLLCLIDGQVKDPSVDSKGSSGAMPTNL